MRVRVMIPTHRRNRDTVVVFKCPRPNRYSSWIDSMVGFNMDLMRKILIKIWPIKCGEQTFCKLMLLVIRPVAREKKNILRRRGKL